MKYPLYLILLSVFTGTLAFPGDVAVFKNLGFSTDGRYFMFGEYGIDGTSKTPYAEVYAVDIVKNTFAPGGISKGSYPVSISIGDDGQKALYVQLEKIEGLRKKLDLDFLNQGRPIYFRVVTEKNLAQADTLKVLDYESGKEYALVLNETHETRNGKDESSFFIDLQIRDKSGNLLKSALVGTPKYLRYGVSNYTISQIILSPNERGLIIVVEKEEQDGAGGVNIRHMVEAIHF